MEILFDETFQSPNGQKNSRNIWYGYLNMSTDGEFGKILKLDDELITLLVSKIHENLKEDKTATETNWYFYGDTTTKDAIGDVIRPTIMIRERNGVFVTNFVFADMDFALQLDKIMSFKIALESALMHS
ncbi:MAG: hypothetical protein LBV67_12455 [Streptococcaceae bacterium]|jgi:hypothetical protein|nr:hypothetical protein [Streptococcaceae bacterium]